MTLLNLMFEILINIKHVHITTKSKVEHDVTNVLYDKFNDTYDKLLEVYAGKYGREKLWDKNNIVKKNNMINMYAYNGNLIEYLNIVLKKIQKHFNNDEEIQNIVDDIKNIIYRSIYLLNLS